MTSQSRHRRNAIIMLFEFLEREGMKFIGLNLEKLRNMEMSHDQ